MRFGEKNEWNASLLAEAVPEFGGMLPSFVMQIEFPSSQTRVSHKDFFFFQSGEADLTCPYIFYKILIYNSFLMSYVSVAAGPILLISGPVKQNG